MVDDAAGKPPLTLVLCEPRGFCAGVDRAIQIVVLALKKYGAPVYVRHEIVHNKYVVDGLKAKGAIFVKELDEIPQTDQPVIFSAHGVPKSVPANAEKRNLLYLDATCPLVSKVHKQALRHIRNNRHVVLVGHAGHPEVVGTMGQVPEGTMTLIETPEEARSLQVPEGQGLGYVTQTTLSVDDTNDVVTALEETFPNMEAPAGESICYATTNRQEAVKLAAPGCDMFYVVGATNSSNSKRLVEVATREGSADAALVADHKQVQWDKIANAKRIGISAGASAPELLVDELIEAFKARYAVTVDIAMFAQENELFPVMRSIRDTPLETADMAFVNGDVAPRPQTRAALTD
ncbi:MAG: 4-hydroxy-3-methylbut-2-enyl diphosphate reductase [Pseudomonadota bacterium]